MTNFKQLLKDANFNITWTVSDERAEKEMLEYNNKIISLAEKVYNFYLAESVEKAEFRKDLYFKNNPLKTVADFKVKRG